ncbi:cobyric acid synthase [Leptospira langatensis]|uniref:Cobyric acid synthase n=1 Tax=Leptospira langatensis TaxID=2484983 RepID=A0A5F1ZY78_9LEPT|nr:cobyric acid synthase [Leptospira langatensis]TGJ98660.1 cobyric acid synthase [Leptospira langatensis]TGL43822.1 cobyric acid synthase [Leptospira langatensis]
MAELAEVSPSEILDFSANLNPLGFPDWVRPLIHSKISDLASYPDPKYSRTRLSIQEFWKIPESEIAFGNGASELIYAIPRIQDFDFAVIALPSYLDYKKAIELAKIPTYPIELKKEEEFHLDPNSLEEILKNKGGKSGIIILGHPNNPTGKLLDRERILEIAKRYPNSFFIIDESFVDFNKEEVSFRHHRTENMGIVWSLTKILALPGLRLGILIASPKIARSVSEQIPDWNLNTLSASVLERSGKDKEFFRETKAKVQTWKNSLEEDLIELGAFRIYKSNANFILLEILDTSLSAEYISSKLLTEFKIGVRNCDNFDGLNKHYIRIAVRTPEENSRLIDAFSIVFGKKIKERHKNTNKPALMLQGTASNVGKSILTTALCRIFTQDGLKVAPFKSQNMALNSFVTFDGAEIGRAQALQAQACKIRADYRMNPILLKPSSEKDSQVILNGKPVDAMDFREYMKFKANAFEEVKKSYDSLSQEFDLVVLEGAGGISEVNLKERDIVNMRMAEYARAKVLLIGNIDHGGVFGSFIGSMETLAEWERRLVAGFIINRFRGIKQLLDPGIEYLEEATGKKVFGIVPFLNNLMLPEEDSLEFKSGSLNDTSPLGDRIDIALIDTPRISNHTDLDALRIEPDVRVRIVTRKEELGSPDVLILAGSKNVITDLDYLKESGIFEEILNFHREGRTEIVGICGGYQMLGESVHDPHQIESDRGSASGLGLIRVRTLLEKQKYLKQTEGNHLPSGKKVIGYEIHHGVTETNTDLKPLFRNSMGAAIGHQGMSENIWGTYLHGIFDEDEFRRWFLDRIRQKKGQRPLAKIQAKYELETSLDRLAKKVRESLDMNRIYGILGI